MRNTENRVPVTGNTYPVKEALKALGARWNGADKAWMIAPEKESEARALVAGAGPKKPFSGAARSNSGFTPSRCRECGVAPSRYRPIYRSGVCKDCYLEEKEEAEMGY